MPILFPIRSRIRNSGLPRTFRNYEVVDPGALSIRGAAPKVIIRHRENSDDFYIAKGAEKWGEIETYSEFFFNRLGAALGLNIAHSGLLKIDGQLHFVSKSFLLRNEILTHGFVIAQDFFSKEEVERIGRKEEQHVYDIEIIREMLCGFCGEAADGIFEKLLEMLAFDALLGSTDRHIQNWGVVVSAEKPRQFRLAPIFDTARSFFWDFNEERLKAFHSAPPSEQRYEGYLRRARPCIGVPGAGAKRVNHFGLVEYLIRKYPEQTCRAFSKIKLFNSIACKCGGTAAPKPCIIAKRVLRESPFDRVFTRLRKEMILRTLQMRAKTLRDILR